MSSGLNGSGEPIGHWRSGKTRGSDVLPEGIAGPQSLLFDVDVVQALSVSCRGSPSVNYGGRKASIETEGLEESRQGMGTVTGAMTLMDVGE